MVCSAADGLFCACKRQKMTIFLLDVRSIAGAASQYEAIHLRIFLAMAIKTSELHAPVICLKTQEHPMQTSSDMCEESMQRMEVCIPELAGNAVKRAYLQALTISGKVVEARNGQLVETTSEGNVRVIRPIAPPIAVKIGAKRVRTRQA